MARRGSFRTGYWLWDDSLNELSFVGRDSVGQLNTMMPADSTHSKQGANQYQPPPRLSFKETVGTMTQHAFKRIYQRKVKQTDPDVVTIQDIKDVVIFICDASQLTVEFINYFHTTAMDRFLRSLIVYFQYYFQVWNALQFRRMEAKRKLRQPIVTVLENIVRNDLADLRSMVARDYAVLLLGIGDAKAFHHMSNQDNESFSDRDRRLFEMMILMAIRVVWVGLCRRYLQLIEKEMNRLLRTKTFSHYEHKVGRTSVFDSTPEEDRILIGKAVKFDQKLFLKSPAAQEIIHDHHDYRMLAIGISDTQEDDPRQLYLEAAYSAPEEELEALEVPVGILGIPRKYFDPMLKPKELSTTGRRMSTMKPIPDFVIPPYIHHRPKSDTLPKDPSKFQETMLTKDARRRQCYQWRDYVEYGGRPPPKIEDTPPPTAGENTAAGENTTAAENTAEVEES